MSLQTQENFYKKPNKTTMWYSALPYKEIFAATFDEMVADFRAQGIPEETIAYLVQQQGADKGMAINYLKGNPSASLQDIQGHIYDSNLNARMRTEQLQRSNAPSMAERQIMDLFPETMQLWPQVQLRKLRLQKTPKGYTYRGFDGGNEEDQGWNLQNTFQEIADWAKHAAREDPYFQLSTFNLQQAIERAKDWHIAMAGQGSNLTYTPYKRNEFGDLEDERVVYTYPDGWHISQVTNKNDLSVEGNRMNHCFAPGAMVRTLDGFKQIEDIELGELVVCGDGTFHKVTKLFKQPYTGLMIRMGTRVGVGANLITPNHEFLSLNKLHGGDKPCQPHLCGKSSRRDEHEIHDVEWKQISELSLNSYLVTSYPLEYFDLDEIEVPPQYTGIGRKGSSIFNVDEEFLWIVGMFIAEGSATKNKIQFAISKNETEYADRLESFFKKHNFGYHWRKDRDSYGGRVLVVCSRMLGEWFGEWFGKGCMNKKIPSVLLNLPNKKIEALARGVLDGDGCSSRNVLHQTSSTLALQMSEISLRLGGFPSISVHYPKNKKASYVLEGADALIPRTSVKRGFWQHKDYVLAKPNVFDIEQYSGFVYNLEVDTIHSYSVQNILVHNCVGSYCSDVEAGDLRIFSLRNPRNEPVTTIELGGAENIVHQIKAKNNAKPGKEIRKKIGEWFATLEDARFPGVKTDNTEVHWDTYPDTIKWAIYEEAYGRDNDEVDYSTGDRHSDYGIPVEADDESRDIKELDINNLLWQVETNMNGTRGGLGGWDRLGDNDDGSEITQALGSVIVDHDVQLLKHMAENPDEYKTQKFEHNIYDEQTKTFNFRWVLNKLGVLDIASKYEEKLTEAASNYPELQDGTGHPDAKALANEDNDFLLYYMTLQEITPELPKIAQEYARVTGLPESHLYHMVDAYSSGGYTGVWSQRLMEQLQPRLMKHKHDFTTMDYPTLPNGKPDESVFDEGGWKYSKRRVNWYK